MQKQKRFFVPYILLERNTVPREVGSCSIETPRAVNASTACGYDSVQERHRVWVRHRYPQRYENRNWDKSRRFNSLGQLSRPLQSRYETNGKCSSVFAAMQFSEKKESHSAQKTSLMQQNERAVFQLTNARACWKATALQKQENLA